MKVKLSLYVTGIMLLAILTVGVGCTKAPNDAELDQQHSDQAGYGFRSAIASNWA